MSTNRSDRGRPGEGCGPLGCRGGASLTGRINHLFSVAGFDDHRGRWQAFGTGEMADLISRSESRYGVRVSRSYLGMLRNGRYTNPSIAVVLALVRFVNDHLTEGHPEITVDWLTSGATAPAPGPGVTPAAASDRSAADGTGAADLPGTLADRQVQHIALRAGRMTPELRDRLIAILDTMEGSP